MAVVAAPYNFSLTTTLDRPVDFASGRSSVVIINNGTDTVFLGVDNSLTTTNGLPLKAGQAIVFSRDFGDDPDLAIYGIANSGTQDLRIQETFGISLIDVLMKK